MKELERYYEKITPSITAEKLTERVISKTEKPKKRISSKFIGIAAAAAAVMTFGVTAAAGSLGYFDVFSNLFGEKAENLTHNILEDAQIIRNDTEKMDFELVAAASDKHGVMVILDVTAKNGFKLGENYLGDARADFDYKLESTSVFCENDGCYTLDSDEDSARIRLRWASHENITGKEFTLTLCEYTEPIIIGKIYESKPVSEVWQAKFTAVDNSIEYEIDGIKICVSPINVTFAGNHFINFGSNLKIITENDTYNVTQNQLGFVGNSSDCGNSELAVFNIYEPINPEEVIALEVNGRRYNLK